MITLRYRSLCDGTIYDLHVRLYWLRNRPRAERRRPPRVPVGWPTASSCVAASHTVSFTGEEIITAFVAGHGNQPVLGRDQMRRRLFQQRRPQGEGALTVAEKAGTEREHVFELDHSGRRVRP